MKSACLTLAFLFLSPLAALHSVEPAPEKDDLEAAVCVYGGASGGVQRLTVDPAQVICFIEANPKSNSLVTQALPC